MAENFKNDVYAFSCLTVRNLKLFFKDKMQVFFSLLAPLIVLFLYVACSFIKVYIINLLQGLFEPDMTYIQLFFRIKEEFV